MSENAPPPPPPSGGMPPGEGSGGYGAPPPVGGYGYAQSATNKKAIWALVLGILGLVLCGFLAGIPAIILGKMAQNEIDVSGGAQRGRGMATAGFVLGIIACVLGVLYLVGLATGVVDFRSGFNSSP